MLSLALTDLQDSDKPLRVYGEQFCGRCAEVAGILDTLGITYLKRDLQPEEAESMMLVDATMWESASVLAVFTVQDGLLPAVLTNDFRGFIKQERIHE